MVRTEASGRDRKCPLIEEARTKPLASFAFPSSHDQSEQSNVRVISPEAVLSEPQLTSIQVCDL